MDLPETARRAEKKNVSIFLFASRRRRGTDTASMLARFAKRAMSYEAKIAELGYKMPAPSKPVASYVMATRVGNLIYTGAPAAAQTAAPLLRARTHTPPALYRPRAPLSRPPARDL